MKTPSFKEPKLIKVTHLENGRASRQALLILKAPDLQNCRCHLHLLLVRLVT